MDASCGLSPQFPKADTDMRLSTQRNEHRWSPMATASLFAFACLPYSASSLAAIGTISNSRQAHKPEGDTGGP